MRVRFICSKLGWLAGPACQPSLLLLHLLHRDGADAALERLPLLLDAAAAAAAGCQVDSEQGFVLLALGPAVDLAGPHHRQRVAEGPRLGVAAEHMRRKRRTKVFEQMDRQVRVERLTRASGFWTCQAVPWRATLAKSWRLNHGIRSQPAAGATLGERQRSTWHRRLLLMAQAWH